MDAFTSSDSSDDDVPSPKKALPDFTTRKSDDDSVASGDDSAGWEVEEDRVLNAFAIQTVTEDALDDIFVDDGPMKEIHEFILIAGRGVDGEEEGNADGATKVNPTTTAVEYETRRVVLQTTNVKMLKAIAVMVNVSNQGKKQLLFNRIRNSSAVTKVSKDEFEYCHASVVGAKVPTWIILTPEAVPSVDGIDMGTGAQKGFFGPTNKENAVGGTRANFLTSEHVERPMFERKKPKKRRKADDDANDPNNPPATREDGHPSDACRKQLPPLSRARPKDFFDTQLTPAFFDWAVMATNLRAYTSGAGSGEYTDFIAFDHIKVYKMIGVLFTNGLTPKPQFDNWFCSEDKEPLLGSNLISNALRRKNLATGKTIKAARRWKHFRRYFTVADYRDSPKEKQKNDPLWKVRELLDELNKQAKDMWVPGKWVAIDEQTIGFQGASGMKLRISYKREGGGFQRDAVCDGGYTYSFYFRHGPPPNVGEQYKHLELSPTARQVVWLASWLPNRWTRIFMDNLFNSEKLFTALHIAESLAHGVARTSGRGVPPSIIQREEKNRDRAEKLRGTTMAAKLHNSDVCPNLFAVSVYDTKPVHILSTAAHCVEWIVKEKKVWSDQLKKKALMKYLRLNVIDDYNNNMNSTDIADQLRGSYRPDRWMRQRKWWWAFFIWVIGVAGVNAYKIYEVMYDEEEAKKTPGLPPRWTHARFLEELIYDFIFPGRSKNNVVIDPDESTGNLDSEASSIRSFAVFGQGNDGNERVYDLRSSICRKQYLQAVPTVRISMGALKGGYFRHRLDGMRHNWIPAKEADHCQYCYYHRMNNVDEEDRRHFTKSLKQNPSRIQRCLVCHENLCPQCDNIFHGANLSAFTRGSMP
jgi:hypothetical protein